MTRYSLASVILWGLLFVFAKADEYKPLEQIVDVGGLASAHRSLLDPTARANTEAFDTYAQQAGSALGMRLNENRGRHVVRAARFVKIPEGVTAEDLARAWLDAGGGPVVREPANGSIYWEAHDEHHFVSDTYVGTGFVCAKPGQAGVQYDEIWARRFLFVTADGGLTVVEPPKCE